MSDTRQLKHDIEALLVAQAIDGLEADELRRLEQLLAQAPTVDPELFERLAAAVVLAELGNPEPMPAALEREIAAQGRLLVGKGNSD